MIVLTSADIARSLLDMMSSTQGPAPEIEQVDFRDCEGGKDIMAYIYFADGSCAVFPFDRPAVLDADEVERMLVCGVPDPVLH